MAFPAVQTADTQSGTVTSNSNSWTLTYPTNLASGDLIVALVAMDGSPTTTWPAGWVKEDDTSGSAVRGTVAKKKSDGTESGTFSLGLSASEQGSWRIFRIINWEGTLGTTWSLASGQGAVARNVDITGGSNTPDPPSLNPFEWDVEDTLWMAVCMVDTSRTISVFPLPDLQTSQPSGGAGGATLGICMDDLTQASLDPGTFTISASDDWVAFTIGVRGTATVYVPRHSAHDFGSVTNF